MKRPPKKRGAEHFWCEKPPLFPVPGSCHSGQVGQYFRNCMQDPAGLACGSAEVCASGYCHLLENMCCLLLVFKGTYDCWPYLLAFSREEVSDGGFRSGRSEFRPRSGGKIPGRSFQGETCGRFLSLAWYEVCSARGPERGT